MAVVGRPSTVNVVILVVALLFIISVPISCDAEASDGPTKIYDTLDQIEKAVYNDLKYAVDNNTSVDTAGLPIRTVQNAYFAFTYDNPEVFWFRHCYQLSLDPISGECTKIEYQDDIIPLEKRKVMEADLEKVVSGIDINLGDSDYSKLRAIHDWIIRHVSYSTSVIDDGVNYAGDIYGAFVLREAECTGYSLAFSYICHMYDFPCVVVLGNVHDSIPHAWNLVYGEGDWYFVDVSWDDKGDDSDYDYFMIGSRTEIRGLTFSTEDHIATTLYGIVPSESKYLSSERKLTGTVIVSIILILVIIFMFTSWRKYTKKKMKEERLDDIRSNLYGSEREQKGRTDGDEADNRPPDDKV